MNQKDSSLQWAIGESVAYQKRGKWIESNIERKTPTQAVLANGRRFRLSDGYLLGPNEPIRIYVKKAHEVADRIQEWKESQANQEYLRIQKARLCAAIETIQPGYFAKLNALQCKAIADFIEAQIVDV